MQLSREPIIRALCHAVTCVPQSKAYRRGKVDFKLGRKNGVGAVLLATQKKRAGGRLFLLLTLKDLDNKVVFEREFPAPQGRMLDEEVGSARDAMLLVLLPSRTTTPSGEPLVSDLPTREVGTAITAEEAAEAEIPAPERRERELLPEEEAALEEQRRNDPYATEEMPEEDPIEEAVEDEHARPNRVLLDYGVDLFSRRFTWAALTHGELLPYKADFVVAPRFAASIQPLLFLPTNPRLPVSLSLDVAYRFAIGLMTRTAESSIGRATGLTQFDLGGAVGWAPQNSSRYVLSGLFGYRAGHFDVAPSATGERSRSLPRLSLRELRLGARLEYLFEAGARLQGDVAFLPVLSAGEVISRAYFLGGGGAGFEASFGGFYPAHRIVDVGALLTLTRVSLSLTHGTDSEFQAKGANEQHLGGSFVIRVRL